MRRISATCLRSDRFWHLLFALFIVSSSRQALIELISELYDEIRSSETGSTSDSWNPSGSDVGIAGNSSDNTIYAVSVSQTVCSGHQDTSTGVCYELHYDQQLSWQDALDACNRNGAQLAWITSKAEEDIIFQLMQPSTNYYQPVWLGGRMESLYRNQFIWRWSQDKSVISSQGCYADNNSARDLPEKITSIPSSRMTVDRCIVACSTAGYLYAGLQSGSDCYCGNQFGMHGRVDSSTGAAVCDVACTGNSAQQCGGTLVNSIYYVNGTYSNWGFVRPNNYLGYQTCGVLSSSVGYKMDDDNCGKPQYPYICDIPTSLCVNGSRMLNAACYFISPSGIQTSWFVARMDCLSRGGDLVKILTPEVWNTLKSAIGSNGPSYWIGLSAAYWYWSNGVEIEHADWFDISTESYGPFSLGNKCLLYDPNSNYQWTDGNCNDRNYYVCIRGKTLTTQTTRPTTVTTTPTTTTQSTTTRPATTTTTTTTMTTATTTASTTTKPPTTTTTAATTTTTTTPTVLTTTTTPKTTLTTTTDNGIKPETPIQIVDSGPSAAQSTSAISSIMPPVEIALITICTILAVVFIALLAAFLVSRRNNRLNQVRSNYGNNVQANNAIADFRSTDKLKDNMQRESEFPSPVISSPQRIAIYD